MCGKLQSDQDNIDAGGREDKMKLGQKGVVLLAAVILIAQLLQTEFAYKTKRRVTDVWQRWRYTSPLKRTAGKATGGPATAQQMAIELAEREARIRRFASNQE